MIEAFFQGIVTGFVLSWTFGTVFFVLIQTSLEKGWKQGMKIAAGVVCSDFLFILIALGLLSFIPNLELYQQGIGTTGGLLLIILGITNFFKRRTTNTSNPKVYGTGKFFYFFSTGVLLNVINPVNFFSWVFVSQTIYPSVSHSLTENIIFYTAVLGTIFGCETFISYSAHKLKRLFNQKMMRNLDILVGSVFLGIGVYMIYKYQLEHGI